MVLPLFKVLSLVLRVFSKPLINYTKQVHLKKDSGNSHPLIRRAFINMGNNYHKCQTYINRKFMKIQTQFAFKPLNDELAIEKGIQFFYEVVFYSIVIGLPLYEMYQASVESKAKSKALDEKLKKIEEQLEIVVKREEQKKKRYEAIKAKSNGNSEQEKVTIVPIQSLCANQIVQTLAAGHSIRLILPKTGSHTYNISYQKKAQNPHKIQAARPKQIPRK